jgi:hypothetical protein
VRRCIAPPGCEANGSTRPLRRRMLLKLLRSTCMHCFKLKMAAAEAERFERRLDLLSRGRLVEASHVALGSGKAGKTALSILGDEGDAAPEKDGAAGAAPESERRESHRLAGDRRRRPASADEPRGSLPKLPTCCLCSPSA